MAPDSFPEQRIIGAGLNDLESSGSIPRSFCLANIMHMGGRRRPFKMYRGLNKYTKHILFFEKRNQDYSGPEMWFK